MSRLPWMRVIWALAVWPFAYVMAALSHVPRWISPAASLVLAYIVVELVWRGSHHAGGIAGSGVLAALQPSGRDRRPALDVGFSKVDSFVARGDVERAERWYRDAIIARPGDWALRMRAAEFFAGSGGQPRRAGRLFAEVAADATAPSHIRGHAGRRAADLERVGADRVDGDL